MKEKEEIEQQENIRQGHVPTIRKSKLLIVDLAGSERIDKSGLVLIFAHVIFIHFVWMLLLYLNDRLLLLCYPCC